MESYGLSLDNKNPDMPVKMPQDIELLAKDAKIQIFKFTPKDRDFNTFNKWTIQIYNIPCDGVVFDLLFCAKYNKTAGVSNADVIHAAGTTDEEKATISESIWCFVNSV